MDEQNLQQIKNTAVKILIARECPDEVGLLMASVRWESRDVETNNFYDDKSLWALNIFLPAEHYARMDRDDLANSAEITKQQLMRLQSPAVTNAFQFLSARNGWMSSRLIKRR